MFGHVQQVRGIVLGVLDGLADTRRVRGDRRRQRRRNVVVEKSKEAVEQPPPTKNQDCSSPTTFHPHQRQKSGRVIDTGVSVMASLSCWMDSTRFDGDSHVVCGWVSLVSLLHAV